MHDQQLELHKIEYSPSAWLSRDGLEFSAELLRSICLEKSVEPQHRVVSTSYYTQFETEA